MINWLENRFGRSSKSQPQEGAAPQAQEKLQQLEALENALNNPIGELLESAGAVSTELKGLVGNIQARSIAVIRKFEAASDEEKQKFIDAGLIKKNKYDEDVFNDGIIFGLANNYSGDDNLEDKAKFILGKLSEKVKDFVTDDEVAAGQAENDTREGVHKGAISTSIIYKALDDDLKDAANIIIAAHAAIRSGYTRLATGRQNPELAKKFFIPFDEEKDDPYIFALKKPTDTLKKIELGELEPSELKPEDIEKIQVGLSTASEKLKKVQANLNGKADLSNLLKMLEDYSAAGTGLWAGFVAQYKQKPSITAVKSDDTDENTQKVEIPQNLDPFMKAFANATGTTFENDTAVKNGSLAWFASALDIEEQDKKSIFTDKNGGYRFVMTVDRIEHIDTDGKLSPQEAMQWIIAASKNNNMMKNGINIDGNPADRAMLLMAYEELKKIEHELPDIKNAEEAYANITQEISQTAQKSLKETFKNFRNEKDEIDFKKAAAAIPETKPAPTAGGMKLAPTSPAA